MKFNTTSVWAAFLVVFSLSVVNAVPVDQAELAALSADELLTRGDTAFVIPEDAKVEEVPEASKKVTGCGYRSFFTYHSCL